jgi:integrase
MHLLQAGVPLITIKDFLGHADVKSTEVYVQSARRAADAGQPRRAMARPRRVPIERGIRRRAPPDC